MKGIDAVIIDEVSMLKAEIIDILDAELKMVYENDKPFGGIQVIAVGDFLQLPPVSQNNEPFEFAFESKA
jgi:ATP-dependent DNA helicase PIF1